MLVKEIPELLNRRLEKNKIIITVQCPYYRLSEQTIEGRQVNAFGFSLNNYEYTNPWCDCFLRLTWQIELCGQD